MDSLTDDERDAIITHPDPTYDGRDWWSRDRDCGCLVGAAVEARRARLGMSPPLVGRGMPLLLDGALKGWSEVGCRFPTLVRRFGPERIWRVVKARASKANRVPVEPSPEPVKAIR